MLVSCCSKLKGYAKRTASWQQTIAWMEGAWPRCVIVLGVRGYGVLFAAQHGRGTSNMHEYVRTVLLYRDPSCAAARVMPFAYQVVPGI